MTALHIPDTHRDLLEDPNCYVALTTVMDNGQPQTTPVWCNCKGDYVLVNTMRDFQKEKNMRANPHVTLLAYHPSKPLHNIEIRGTVVEMTKVGAMEHLNQLTGKYIRKPNALFFGDGIAAELKAQYVPVRITIAPSRLRVEG